ncbi:hypothetical protein SEENIN0B_02370 [Salmonella enterica subsp. enterica serovar Infantis str. SARB27]|uniref:Uncharacterized protein n=1 Tax=Salmonella enterica subsp. enterica serovar Infantis str. SARB27 TaxID=596155 RepID=A0A6C8G9V2_SALIN|nr:hypothetical protein SEENIN0B_02370 [Salmonella enterica subsp. enterica serovar Infantis str. SARB27]
MPSGIQVVSPNGYCDNTLSCASQKSMTIRGNPGYSLINQPD